MGQKVNPVILRIPYIKNWNSKWFAKKADYARLVQQDVGIRRHIKKKLRTALISKVEIERSRETVTIIVHAAKPGMLIGRGGAGIEELKKVLQRKFIKNNKIVLRINIVEVKNPYSNAAVVMQNMIFDIEKRVPYRTVMKQALSRANRDGVLGIKVQVSGRLNGAEIARTETIFDGKIPLHTLRANIDYARGVARTTYGAIGVKVWVYKGDIFKTDESKKS